MSSSDSESGSSSPRAASPDPPPSKKSKSSKKRKNDLDEIEVDLALPEPPSKKAKRALKKGKPLPPKKDSDDEGGAGEKANGDNHNDVDDNKPAKKEKERSPYGVWIGNLRFTVTKDDLRRWLIDNSGGALTEDVITRVHLPASKQNRGLAEFENRGFAYVDFTTYDATVAAIALSETEWHRRKLLIKDAKSYEGRPEEHLRKKKDAEDNKKDAEQAAQAPQSTSRKVFVGNMSFQTTEDDLRELFSKCGEIEWVKVATFEDSGKCKGYGWVKFKEAAAADWAAKGFVKIKETEETEEDFMDVDEQEEKEEAEEASKASEDDEDEEENDDEAATDEKKSSASKKQKPAPEKRVKMRKWWVNQLNGRRLKIEHAEDDQTRYKKRFGKKDYPQQQQEKGSRQDSRSSSSKFNNRNKGGADFRSAENRGPAEVSNYRSDINVARLTGAAVKPEGKKTTFE